MRLFRDIPASLLSRVEQAAELQIIEAGIGGEGPITSQGDVVNDSSFLYVVMSGAVTVHHSVSEDALPSSHISRLASSHNFARVHTVERECTTSFALHRRDYQSSQSRAALLRLRAKTPAIVYKYPTISSLISTEPKTQVSIRDG